MNYITITTEKNETYSSISNHFIDYYMTDANGEFVKVYLYLVRLMSSKSPVSVSDIADHFNLTEKEICRAIKYWISQEVLKLNYDHSGVLTGITLLPLKEKSVNPDLLAMDNITFFNPSSKSAQMNQDDDEETMYDSEVTYKPAKNKPVRNDSPVQAPKVLPKKKIFTPVMAKKAGEDDEFSDIIFLTETYFENTLSVHDIETLIYIHEQLHFPFELMEYLIEYCVTLDKKSLRYAEVVAGNWYKSGIQTVEAAKEASLEYNPMYKSIFKELGFEKRQRLAPSEAAFIDTWIKEWGFELPLILEACKRARLAQPENVTFPYVNKILERWYKNNVKSIRDLEQLDKEYQEKKALDQERKTKPKTKTTSFSSFENKDMSKELKEMEKLLLKEVNT